MIQITDKHSCCGCASCVQICPEQCISFDEDERGFRYPEANTKECINCGLCEKVCPFLNSKIASNPIKVIAAINPDDEIRIKSSSGGIFSILGEYIINEGGVVFGASFDENWEVRHTFTENIAGIDAFRGAKYLQSLIGETFKQVKTFLLQGRKVLFSGTGCQIAGLRLFLRKEYENLLTVEIACHGVPSPRVWREYLEKVTGGERVKVKSISFRDKRCGWNGYGLSITSDNEDFYEKAETNLYMQAFLKDLCLRPSCDNCPSKHGASGSDIIIGDFWGVENIYPEMYDNNGCSLVIVNSQKGKNILEMLNIKEKSITYEDGYRYNPCLVKSASQSRYASLFWHRFKNNGIRACKETLDVINRKKLIRILMLLYSKLFLRNG